MTSSCLSPHFRSICLSNVSPVCLCFSHYPCSRAGFHWLIPGIKNKEISLYPIHSICYDSLTLVRWGMALIIHSFRKYSQLSFRRGFFIYIERETTHLAFYTSTPIDLCSGLSVSRALSSFAQATGTQPILNSALEALSIPSLA